MIEILGIEHNVLNDAPFIGAIIIASKCKKNCNECINEHLKNKEPIKIKINDIFNEVLNNKLNQGIIFGGLEWTYQPQNLKDLVFTALQKNLKVMIYTYMEEEEFKLNFYDLYKLPIWVKFGCYNKNLQTKNNIQFGIKLASSNQYIKYLGGN